MNLSQGDALYYLIGVVSLLFFILLGSVIWSQRRRKRPDLPQPESQPERDVTPAPVAEKSLDSALANTRSHFFGRIKGLFAAAKPPEIEEIEEILYTSDLGPKTVQRLMGAVQKGLKSSQMKDSESVKEALKGEMLDIFSQVNVTPTSEHPFWGRLNWSTQGPTVWLIVGVNGAGKTTTIGKIAGRLGEEGKKVLVAAGDTFRAAAGEQLKIWADRASVEVFDPPSVKDPSAVAFDALNKAVAKAFDVVLIDTAGRLHTQTNLMEELKKVKRVMQKVIPGAPHEVLLVLDANSGQNGLNQAREFHQAVEVTGAVLTKLDGTSKGGVIVGVAHDLGLPVKFIGIGEKIGDLRPFSSSDFVNSIL